MGQQWEGYLDHTVQYAYDEVGNRKKLIYPDNTHISYEYDELNRLTSIEDQYSVVLASYVYDALSRRIQLDLANGTQTTYEYDMGNRLTNLTHYTLGQIPGTYAYTYDKVGNRQTMVVDETDTHTYTYDKTYQLKTVDYPEDVSLGPNVLNGASEGGEGPGLDIDREDVVGPDIMANEKEGWDLTRGAGVNRGSQQFQFSADVAYNYDALGNRISEISYGKKTNYTTNSLNQYTTVAGIPYSYDANGNLTSDGNWIFAYDFENRLINATRQNRSFEQGSITANYSYDPFGRRIRKIVSGGTFIPDTSFQEGDQVFGSGLSGPQFNENTADFIVTAITNYLYDGDQVIAEYDVEGILLRKFIYGPGIDEPVVMNDAITGQDYYYHFDGLGSVTEMTDAGGLVQESYKYDTYGQTGVTSSVENPYLFSGRRYDSETGIYYYRARHYSSKIGRFLQVDPFRDKNIRNLYTYCGNDPINYIDPIGLEKKKEAPYNPNAFDLLTRYGNWGGEHWSGGEWLHSGEVGESSVPATDWVDKWWKYHDLQLMNPATKIGATDRTKAGSLEELTYRLIFMPWTVTTRQNIAVRAFYKYGHD